MTVAGSYLRKIKSDNLEQDFNKALNQQFESIDNKTNQLLKSFDNANKEQFKKFEDYQEIIDKRIKQTEKRMDTNDSLIKKYNISLDFMTKGITAMFFVVMVMALILVATGPIGDFLGVQQMYNSLDHEIKTHTSIWHYLYYVLYLIPYVIFYLIILGILKACEKLFD